MTTKTRCKEVKIKGETFCVVPKQDFLVMQMLEASALDAVEYANAVIGRKIRMAREAIGLTQTEAAARAKMRPEVLSRIESGRGNPTVATINRIMRAIA